MGVPSPTERCGCRFSRIQGLVSPGRDNLGQIGGAEAPPYWHSEMLKLLRITRDIDPGNLSGDLGASRGLPAIIVLVLVVVLDWGVAYGRTDRLSSSNVLRRDSLRGRADQGW
jgi:hypothetical protein